MSVKLKQGLAFTDSRYVNVTGDTITGQLVLNFAGMDTAGLLIGSTVLANAAYIHVEDTEAGDVDLWLLNKSDATESNASIWMEADNRTIGFGLVVDGLGTYSDGIGSAAIVFDGWTNHPMVFNTNYTERIRIAGDGVITVKDKIAFTQADGDEYIDSLGDGYLDIGATTAIRMKADVSVDDAKNIILNTTTGTKIGTATGQKLGFWNVAPVIQPAGATQAAPAAYSTGGFGLDSDANMQALYDLVVAMRTALVNSGIIKGAA